MKLPATINEILIRQHGVISSHDIASAGVSRTMLGKYVAAGLLERTERGMYSAPDSVPDVFFALHKRCSDIVFSHESALFLLGVSERTPFTNCATAKSSRTLPRSIRRDIACFYIRNDLFGLGRITVKTPFGNTVPCYDLERTICDSIRSRSRFDTEYFVSTLRNYAASPARNLARLGSYAKRMGLSAKVASAMEVLI